MQAFAGVGASPAAAEASKRMQRATGHVVVVCTPSGGAQSVRLELPPEWAQALSDADLSAAIQDARK